MPLDALPARLITYSCDTLDEKLERATKYQALLGRGSLGIADPSCNDSFAVEQNRRRSLTWRAKGAVIDTVWSSATLCTVFVLMWSVATQ